MKRGRRWLNRVSTELGEGQHCVSLGEESRGPKLKALSVFLSIIRKALLSHSQVDSNPFAQAQLDCLSWSHQFLKFGSGIYDRPAT